MGPARVGDRPLRWPPRDLDRLPGGRCRADRHGLQDRPGRARLLDGHGSPAAGDVRPDRAAPRPLRGPPPRAHLTRRGSGAAPRRPPRAEPLLQVGREPAPLLQRPQGAAADEGARRPRRLGDRPPPRPVGLALRHQEGRDRPRPRRDREAEPARRVAGGRGLGLPPRERGSRPIRSTSRATPRSAARPARSRSPRASPFGQAAGGGRRTPRRSAACTARSRRAASSTSCTRSSARARMPDAAVAAAIKVSEAERELALAETRAVLAAAASEEYRERAARARGGARGRGCSTTSTH